MILAGFLGSCITSLADRSCAVMSVVLGLLYMVHCRQPMVEMTKGGIKFVVGQMAIRLLKLPEGFRTRGTSWITKIPSEQGADAPSR